MVHVASIWIYMSMYSLRSAYPLALNLELGAYHMLEAMKPNNLPLIDFMEGCSLLYAFECMNKCHAPLPKIRRNGVAARVGDVYTRGEYPTYTR